MKTAIIFGITGQDGSYLCELLLSKGYRVIGVARRTSSPNNRHIRHLLSHEALKVVRGDVTDPLCIYRLLKEVVDNALEGDADLPIEIYNLCAQSHVGDSFVEPHHTTQVTYLGALNILEAIRCYGVNGRIIRFYQASSSEMFGSSYSTRTLPDGSVEKYQDESTTMLPCSPYAIAKLAAHHLCRVYRESYGIYATSGILFNHESVRRSPEFVTRKIANYVANWGNRSTEPGPLRLGNLKAYRDWGHAVDYVRAMWLMLQQEEPDDYVICTGETHTVEEFLLKAFAAEGLEAQSIDSLPVVIDPSLYRPCEVDFLRGDASKARTRLGWSPEISFDCLVKGMVYQEDDLLEGK